MKGVLYEWQNGYAKGGGIFFFRFHLLPHYFVTELHKLRSAGMFVVHLSTKFQSPSSNGILPTNRTFKYMFHAVATFSSKTFLSTQLLS